MLDRSAQQKTPEISFDFQYFMSFNSKEQKNAMWEMFNAFLPIIQCPPPPTHISGKNTYWTSMKEHCRVERLKNILTYFYKWNIISFRTTPREWGRYVLNCFSAVCAQSAPDPEQKKEASSHGKIDDFKYMKILLPRFAHMVDIHEAKRERFLARFSHKCRKILNVFNSFHINFFSCMI